jgi:hypothetical protein
MLKPDRAETTGSDAGSGHALIWCCPASNHLRTKSDPEADSAARGYSVFIANWQVSHGDRPCSFPIVARGSTSAAFTAALSNVRSMMSSLRAGMPGKEDRYVQRAEHQHAVRSTQLSTTGHSPARSYGQRAIGSKAQCDISDNALDIAERIEV